MSSLDINDIIAFSMQICPQCHQKLDCLYDQECAHNLTYYSNEVTSFVLKDLKLPLLKKIKIKIK